MRVSIDWLDMRKDADIVLELKGCFGTSDLQISAPDRQQQGFGGESY